MKRSREEEEDKGNLLHLPHTKRIREEHSLSSKGCSWVRGSMIGKGGFGSVFLAYNNKPTSSFKDFPPVMAVKSVEATSCSELVKEKILLQIVKDSPFIIRFYGEDVTVGYKGKIIINLFLEYASGGSLMDLIEKSKASEGVGLVESQVKKITESILKGIKRIHEAGYVHCDLKPQNILLVPQENSSATPFVAKIADFGLAKAAQGLTRSSEVKGTLMYLPPEAVNFGIQDQPSDVWALGCIVLCMLTGKIYPWDLKSWEGNRELKQKISEDCPEIPNGLSKKAKDFLKQCFMRSPYDRPTADMLLGHPFICSGLGRGGDEDKEELMSVHSVQASSCKLSEPHDEFRASFIPLLNSSFGETEEVQGKITPVISDRLSSSAVCSAA
ncbi:hypothetical protein FEM48_Zijuj10G0097500 [Ziziphus jujuba var. spinosa]|uniref:Protein kinase domain-containing protein n=1 Tax=Ziziphus jujuba var. spinosa TaxID=714518 RepID=A0A978UMN4_ZIZJJ|nr:hypothetical protein FEM48_Zijuj10G0097500 [Ziziphus jujuba var. spinosa]